MEKIILASASPRRKELLAQAGFSFEVMVSQAEEIITKTEPGAIVEELSQVKARAVARQIQEEALIIGADTLVALDGEVLGKPKDEKEAEEMLFRLQDHTHQVYTGVTLIWKNGEKDREESFHVCTQVVFYPMSRQEIRDYIQTGEPMDKAGAYGIQGRAGVFVKEIQGDYNNVVGLPISRLYQQLKECVTV